MRAKLRIKRSQRAYWEGKGRRILMVPDTAIRKLISKTTFFDVIYVTDLGNYPKAASHYVERAKGSPENIIFYCASGCGWYETEMGSFRVNSNQFFILPSNLKHRYGADSEDPWSIYWIMFSGKFSKGILGVDPIRYCFKPNTLLHSQKFLDLFEDMFETLSEGYTISNLLLSNMNLWAILMLFIHQKVDKNRKLKDTPVSKIINFMKENIAKKLSVDEIAAVVALSSSHLYTLFKSQTGYSPLDYFIHLKIQFTCDYLNDTSLRIKEIAQLVGYKDPYLFTRIFTKVMGQSPRKYRSALRV
ncbi:MAG: AraC family transcriptional regulator [Cyclobacteriaceae bacterium]